MLGAVAIDLLITNISSHLLPVDTLYSFSCHRSSAPAAGSRNRRGRTLDETLERRGTAPARQKLLLLPDFASEEQGFLLVLLFFVTR